MVLSKAEVAGKSDGRYKKLKQLQQLRISLLM
jgi:hypothetical protein